MCGLHRKPTECSKLADNNDNPLSLSIYNTHTKLRIVGRYEGCSFSDLRTIQWTNQPHPHSCHWKTLILHIPLHGSSLTQAEKFPRVDDCSRTAATATTATTTKARSQSYYTLFDPSEVARRTRNRSALTRSDILLFLSNQPGQPDSLTDGAVDGFRAAAFSLPLAMGDLFSSYLINRMCYISAN